MTCAQGSWGFDKHCCIDHSDKHLKGWKKMHTTKAIANQLGATVWGSLSWWDSASPCTSKFARPIKLLLLTLSSYTFDTQLSATW